MVEQQQLPPAGPPDLLTKESLTELLQCEVASCDMDEGDLEKINQLSSMRWATVRFSETNKAPMRVVLKVTRSGNNDAKLHGLAREGIFYSSWRGIAARVSKDAGRAHELMASFMPIVFFAEGDMESGAKRILMEDLGKCVQAGYFFGVGNPNNWGKDLQQEIVEKEAAGGVFFRGLDVAGVTRLCFMAAARLHAGFWNCSALVVSSDLRWLRGAGWLAGEGREAWEGSQLGVRQLWNQAKAKMNSETSEEAVRWDALIVELLDASIAKTSWEAYQEELRQRPYTLTHGDFHPANFMVRPGDYGGMTGAQATKKLALLDWELVGVGSGPQDLGQFMISHVEPEMRVSIEKDAVHAYFEELCAAFAGDGDAAVSFSWEQCWDEYVQGGLGRWLWFLPMLTTLCPPKMGQFFHDQVHAFAKTHGITVSNVPMPRA